MDEEDSKWITKENSRSKTARCRNFGHSSEMQNDVLMHREGFKDQNDAIMHREGLKIKMML